MRHLLLTIGLCCLGGMLATPLHAADAPVRAYETTVDQTVAGATVPQRRWVLENDRVRVAVTDDPGGAVVSFVDLDTGTDYVAGQVSSRLMDGAPQKQVGWGWKESIADNANDPIDRRIQSQLFTVSFDAGEDGAQSIRVVGQTAEQRVTRLHTLRPGSAELQIHTTLTNIADHPRSLYLRWHPYSYGMADRFGDSGVVLSPGPGDQVRKIRVGWGWDHWFATEDGYWLAADYARGDGLFMTFEKEKAPLHSTWTQYSRRRDETKGSVVFEPFIPPVIRAPGESVSLRVSYLPFSADTAVDSMPLGVLTDAAERERARDFLRRVKPLDHLRLFGAHSFALSLQFDWHHRRRDLIGVRDWGFMDCAIVGFPYQYKATRVRFVGAFFDAAAGMKGLPKNPRLIWQVTITDADGQQVYRHNYAYDLTPGVLGDHAIDHEVPIPMDGVADGAYTLRVEALDPITRKPFHQHETDVVIIGDAVDAATARLADSSSAAPAVRPFVADLAKRRDAWVGPDGIRIPIGVEEAGGIDRDGWPICLGVPFPRGVMHPFRPLTLVAPGGRRVPFDQRIMSVWPDGSLKWLQIAFAADCPANSHVFYRLTDGDGLAAGPPIVTESDDMLMINNGPLQVRLPRDRFVGVGEVWWDRDRDGEFVDSERMIETAHSRDAYWTGADGETYAMSVDGPAAGPLVPGVSIESNGSERAVVRVAGWYTAENGKRPAFGELRLEFARGRADFKVWHRVTYTGSPWDDELAAYGLRLRLPADRFSSVAYEVDGAAVSRSGRSQLQQLSDDRLRIQGGGETTRGRRSDGALTLIGAGESVLIYHPEWWQRYPKAYDADPARGSVDIQYWPAFAGTHSYAPVDELMLPSSSSPEAAGAGTSRTEEIVIAFAAERDVTAAHATYGVPVVAATPPSWVRDTDALGTLSAWDPERHPELERALPELIGFFERNQDLFRFYGHFRYGTHHNIFQIPLYRWLTVGRYANIGNEENIQRAPWLAWYRSGDRRYLAFATAWTRHLMEVQSIHWHPLFPEYAGMSRRHHVTPWLSGGDWGHTMIGPFLEYYHATGYTPAWQQAVQAADSMANTHDGATWRYVSNPIIANSRMYLETGNTRFKDVADRLWRELCDPDRSRWYDASHGSRMARWYGPLNPQVRQYWEDWTRNGLTIGKKALTPFDNLDSYADLYRDTGDIAFAHQARIQFDGFVQGRNGQLGGHHPIYRGMIPTITQTTVGHMREAMIAGDAIADSRAAFPAPYYSLINTRGVVIRQDQDAPITLRLSLENDKLPEVTGPDGAAIEPTANAVYQPLKGRGRSLWTLTIPADGQTGVYRVALRTIGYLSSSEPRTAIETSDRIQGGGGAPLYLARASLPGDTLRYRLFAAPATEVQISADDQCLCSATHLRPQEDAVAREGAMPLPADRDVLQLDARRGLQILGVDSLLLYLHPDAIFSLEKSAP